MIGALAAGLLAGLAVALPIGAIGSYLIGLAARDGLLVAAAAALGVASTDGLYALVAGTAASSVRRPLQAVATQLNWTAFLALAAFGCWTALRVIAGYRNPAAPTGRAGRPTALRAYLGLLALTALNPATVGYFLALVLGRTTANGPMTAPAAGLFAAGAFLASASWQLLLAGSGALLGRLIAGARMQLVLGLGSATIMLVLAASLVAS